MMQQSVSSRFRSKITTNFGSRVLAFCGLSALGTTNAKTDVEIAKHALAANVAALFFRNGLKCQ